MRPGHWSLVIGRWLLTFRQESAFHALATNIRVCHPERRFWFALRTGSEVEGPLKLIADAFVMREGERPKANDQRRSTYPYASSFAL